jgi:L-ribulose-5-phosphate 3-epimerase
MRDGMNRRGFLAASAAVGAGLALARSLAGAEFKTRLRPALIRGLPDDTTLADLKAVGFEGLECTDWGAAATAASAARERAAAQGMVIHSVLRGWCEFNHADAAKVQADIESVKVALRTAQLLGADAVLLVPCRVGGTMPEPWDFRLEFEPGTLRVLRVVEGDNAPFAAYIAAQNQATETSRKAVEALLPEAEKCGVAIALENVWNNLWVSPDFFAAFVKSFNSPWVKAYLDLGNHIKYAPTPRWIDALGDRIAKCHVKDFRLNPDGKGGSFVDIGDGSNDWGAVRAALERVGYNGWLTIEGSDGLSMAEQYRRLDRIIRGA